MTARIGDLERRYVAEVLDGGFRSSTGSVMTSALEREFAERFDCGYAISFANGTATMHAALVAAGVGVGAEVIVPPLTMSSTAFAVLHAGATPVFADVDPRMWTVDPDSVRERTTERTRAVIPVSIYGLSPDLDPLMDLAAERALFVLEDDAQCLLGRYKNRVVGSIGHASSFSFQSSKHMTSGEGGMVTTSDEGLADRIRRFGSLGYAAVGAAPGKSKISKDVIQDPGYLRHESVGFNYRMSELCAAVARGQLERLDDLVAVRVRAAKLYMQALAGCDWLIPQAVPDGYEHTFWTFAVALDEEAGITWREFRDAYCRAGGDPMYGAWQLSYLEPALRRTTLGPSQTQVLDTGLCPIAESLQPRLLQFKTNYWDPADAERAACALADTVAKLAK
jgi:perosamine synthetase